MAQSLQGPKGTRDFYPDEMAFEQRLFDSWHKSAQLHGFEQYEGPMFEHLELYTQKSGDEIEKQLYAFEDKGGRHIALRPELTPTLARMVAALGTNLKRPIRWYSISRLFRYERMQKGRLREFIQLNMDILGESEVTADAELIAAAIGMMKNLGFDENDFKVRVSSRTLLEELFLKCGVESDKLKSLYALLDKKNKITPDAFLAELKNIVADENICQRINAIFNCAAFDEIEKTMPAAAELQSLCELKKLFALLDNYGLGDYIVFDIGIVRGLAYYTGIVFELFDAKGTMRAIAGGGRYDNLVALYGGPKTPACGFAAGDVVIGDLLKAKFKSQPHSRSDVFIISLPPFGYLDVIKTANTLRAAGISCEFALKENLNVGKQLKSADAANAKFALFIGGDESADGNVRLKNLASGSEEVVSADNVCEKILGALKIL